MSSSGFAVLVALTVHLSLAALFYLFPFTYDRRRKRAVVRIVLSADLAVSAAATVGLGVYLSVGHPGYHGLTDATVYGWGLIGAALSHGVTLQAPAAVVSRIVDRRTSAVLDCVAGLLAEAMYSGEAQKAVKGLAHLVNAEAELLEDYRLIRPLRTFISASVDYPIRDMGEHLYRLVVSSGAGVSQLRSPLSELNFILSLSGASAAAAIALAVARS